MSNVVYLYEIDPGSGQPLISGEVEARDAAHARRLLISRLSLEANIDTPLIANKSAGEDAQTAQRRETLRYVLRALTGHYAWLDNVANGVQADLCQLLLRGLDFSDRNLRMVRFCGADLEEADLSNADLREADLTGAGLQNANLAGADLSDADFSDADLRGANLLGAKLDGADLWRANLRGVRIAPEDLHRALGCSEA